MKTIAYLLSASLGLTNLIELDAEVAASKSDGGIIESNSRMFEALVQKGGSIPTRFSPVPDIYEKLIQTLKDAINDYDMVLFIVGTSAGRDDYTVHVLKALGEAHMAPFHLLDEETGEYNIPFIKKLFPSRQMAIIKGVGRVQCIMTQQGNPLGIKSIDDLTKGSFINRQRGAGTRLLLDYQLKLKNINPSKISGYEKEAATYMAVAAVQSGNVDAGIGIQSAAKAMGLDYIPIGEEAYDFAMPVEFLELPHVKSFIKVLQCDAFKLKLAELGGYTSINCGAVFGGGFVQ